MKKTVSALLLLILFAAHAAFAAESDPKADLLKKLEAKPAVVTVEGSALDAKERRDIEKAFPDTSIVWEDEFLGVKVKTGDTHVRFDGMENVPADEVRRLLELYPDVNKVDMFEARLPQSDMLSLFDEFPKVDLGFTIRFAEHVVRTDQTAFSTLHSKYDQPHTTEQISVLRMCRHLKALDIGHNAVDNVDFLYQLPNIRILIIALNRIEDLTPVGSLKDLEYLEMFTNRIRDLTPLLACKKLKDLNIGFNRIEDLEPLYHMPQLERLWMYSYRYINQDSTTPEIRQRLREALPKCEFEFSHYPTLEGWREHPRYFVMYDIFKTGVWRDWNDPAPAEEGKKQ